MHSESKRKIFGRVNGWVELQETNPVESGRSTFVQYKPAECEPQGREREDFEVKQIKAVLNSLQDKKLE